MNLKKLIGILEMMVPLKLAESWDNVGLLIDPLQPKPIKKIMLTIDLSEAVVDEAIEHKIDLILTYHPILFHPSSRFSANRAHDRTVMKLIQQHIAVYSPHTALDSVSEGVNDWLAQAVGEGPVQILRPHPEVVGMGQGRLVKLAAPLAIDLLAERVKSFLNLDHVRVAVATPDRPVKTVALCAGAGSDVFRGVRADCYLTGEMSHHNVLAATLNGTHVILCEHTNTERGFLPTLAKQLSERLEASVEILLSAVDADPLITHS